MDANVAVVLVAVIGVIVPITTTIIKFIQDSRIAGIAHLHARSAAEKAEETRAVLVDNTSQTDAKLEVIHRLVNNQLSEVVARFTAAFQTIDELKKLLVEIAPQDPRVKAFTQE